MRASKFTAVDFFDDLTSPYARKRFFWGFLLLCALCGGLIYLALQFVPNVVFREVIIAIFIEIIAGSLIVLAFYSIYIYFIGVNVEVSVTRPQDIRERMKSLPLDVSRYMFWGRSGSFFRAYPLMELDRQANEQKKIIDVEIVLPDPTDERLIELYEGIIHALGETTSKTNLSPTYWRPALRARLQAQTINSSILRYSFPIFFPPSALTFRTTERS